MTETPLASFAVQRAIGTFPGEDHVVNIEGTPPLILKITPCKRAGKGTDIQDLAY